jgi:hypothetical protein
LIDRLLAESEVWKECISEYNGAGYLFGALASKLNPAIYGGVQIFKFSQEGYKFQAKWKGDKTKKIEHRLLPFQPFSTGKMMTIRQNPRD